MEGPRPVTRPRHGGDPIALLPAPMRRLARDRVGWVLVLLWIPLLAAAVALTGHRAGRGAPAAEPVLSAEDAPTAENEAAADEGGEEVAVTEVEVRGAEELRIARPDARGARAFAGGAARGRIEPTPDGAVARDEAGAILFTAARDGEQIRVLDGQGGPAFRLKLKDDSGFAVYGPDGNLRCRVKPKPDKLNVYDAQGVRVRHGKLKGGALIVRDGQDRQVLTIEGTRDLGRSGLLAAPIPEPVRALLWSLAPAAE